VLNHTLAGTGDAKSGGLRQHEPVGSEGLRTNSPCGMALKNPHRLINFSARADLRARPHIEDGHGRVRLASTRRELERNVRTSGVAAIRVRTCWWQRTQLIVRDTYARGAATGSRCLAAFRRL